MSNKIFRNNGGHKCVKTQDGEQMAQRIGAVAYVENSALTKEGVRNVSTKRKCSGAQSHLEPKPIISRHTQKYTKNRQNLKRIT